jgi:hypothetical protein
MNLYIYLFIYIPISLVSLLFIYLLISLSFSLPPSFLLQLFSVFHSLPLFRFPSFFIFCLFCVFLALFICLFIYVFLYAFAHSVLFNLHMIKLKSIVLTAMPLIAWSNPNVSWRGIVRIQPFLPWRWYPVITDHMCRASSYLYWW